MRMQSLADFRQQLQSLMSNSKERPFVCSGNPLDCRFFIVGFNPATTVGTDFWNYWSDDHGFDKFDFMEDYLQVRKLRGVRPRIEAMVEQFPANWSLETNICSVPTKRASDLGSEDRRTAIFQFLFDAIKPDLIFVHSNEPIEFFLRATGCEKADNVAQAVEWRGHRFTLFGRSGPIWRMAIDDARELGTRLARRLWEGPEGYSADQGDTSLFARHFASRFSHWSIRLPFLDLELRRAGRLFYQGWNIHYCFGNDERGEYLDYRAGHRMMSGDEHVRIYSDGEIISLPSLVDFYEVGDDLVEDERFKREFNEKNTEILNILKAKGFA